MMAEDVKATAGIKVQALGLLHLGSLGLAHLSRWMVLEERLFWRPSSNPILHRTTVLSDRWLSGLVDLVLRAQVVEVEVPTPFSSLPEHDRAGTQHMNLKQHLTRGSVRSFQLTRRRALAYIVSAGNLSLGYCSNRPTVPHHPCPKEAEDALELAEPGKPASCLFSSHFRRRI